MREYRRRRPDASLRHADPAAFLAAAARSPRATRRPRRSPTPGRWGCGAIRRRRPSASYLATIRSPSPRASRCSAAAAPWSSTARIRARRGGVRRRSRRRARRPAGRRRRARRLHGLRRRVARAHRPRARACGSDLRHHVLTSGRRPARAGRGAARAGPRRRHRLAGRAAARVRRRSRRARHQGAHRHRRAAAGGGRPVPDLGGRRRARRARRLHRRAARTARASARCGRRSRGARRGYGTALVAALSRELLAAGAPRLFLMTDVGESDVECDLRAHRLPAAARPLPLRLRRAGGWGRGVIVGGLAAEAGR